MQPLFPDLDVVGLHLSKSAVGGASASLGARTSFFCPSPSPGQGSARPSSKLRILPSPKAVQPTTGTCIHTLEKARASSHIYNSSAD